LRLRERASGGAAGTLQMLQWRRCHMPNAQCATRY